MTVGHVTTIRVTDRLRVACLRIALKNKQIIDIVDDDNETIRGRVLAIDSVQATEQWATSAQWIVLIELLRRP